MKLSRFFLLAPFFAAASLNAWAAAIEPLTPLTPLAPLAPIDQRLRQQAEVQLRTGLREIASQNLKGPAKLAALQDLARKTKELGPIGPGALARLDSVITPPSVLAPATQPTEIAASPSTQPASVEAVWQAEDTLRALQSDLAFTPLLQAPLPEDWPEFTPIDEVRLLQYPAYRMAVADRDTLSRQPNWTRVFQPGDSKLFFRAVQSHSGQRHPHDHASGNGNDRVSPGHPHGLYVSQRA